VDTETTGAENTLPEEEVSRKPGRPPPIVMTSTTNLIRLQSDLEDHIKGEYEFRNTRNGTRIITKEMADYSAMKSYLEKIISTILPSPKMPKPLSKQQSVTFPQTRQRKIFQQP
jgi:hypothetical protein